MSCDESTIVKFFSPSQSSDLYPHIMSECGHCFETSSRNVPSVNMIPLAPSRPPAKRNLAGRGGVEEALGDCDKVRREQRRQIRHRLARYFSLVKVKIMIRLYDH